MDKTLQSVYEFHLAFGQFCGTDITYVIPPEVKMLRHTLISEEYLELLKAESEDDTVEIADALCDLKYVLNGTIIAHGFHNHWNLLYDTYRNYLVPLTNKTKFRIDDYLYHCDDTILNVLLKIEYFIEQKVKEHGMEEMFAMMFDEVHSSNMSKTCSDLPEVVATIEKYGADGIVVDFVERNGKYVVFRVSDNKALKSINFRPPNLSTFLQN